MIFINSSVTMKNLKIIITLISSVIFNSSCQESESGKGVLIDVSLEISVKSKDGLDLLDSKTPNHLDESEFKILFEEDGEMKEFYHSSSTIPNGFLVFEHEKEFRFATTPVTYDIEDDPITFIQWSMSDIDTMQCHVIRSNGYVAIDKVWFNQVEVWDMATDNDERYFEIIK